MSKLILISIAGSLINQFVTGERYSAFSLLPSAANRSVFICPEKFGYFPDIRDCTRYFVCVFGEPLHESCTGGLYFSAELQTCDWPRNVLCANEDQNREIAKSFYNIADQGEDDDYDYNVNNGNEKKFNKTLVNNEYSGLPHKNFTNIEVGYVNNVDNWVLKSNEQPENRTNSANQFETNLHKRQNERSRTTKKPLAFRNNNENKETTTTTTTESPKVITDPLSHNNKINSDVELQAPKYEEAIPSLVDSKGGIHFSDGPGGTFGLNEQLPGVLSAAGEQDTQLFIKPVFANDNDKEFISLRKSSKNALQRALISQKYNSVPKSKYEYIPVITPEKLFFKATRNPFDLDDVPQYRTQSDRKDDTIIRKDEHRRYRTNQRETPKYQQQIFKQHQEFKHNFNDANNSFQEYDTINMRDAYSVPNSEVLVIPIVVKEPKNNNNNNRRGRVRVVPRKRIKSSTPATDSEELYGVYFDDSRNYGDVNPNGNQPSFSTNSDSTTTQSTLLSSTLPSFTHHSSPKSFPSQSHHPQKSHKYYAHNNNRGDYPLPIPSIETYRTTPSTIPSYDNYRIYDKPSVVEDNYRSIDNERRYNEPRKVDNNDNINFRKKDENVLIQYERTPKPARYEPPHQPLGVEYSVDYEYGDSKKQNESPQTLHQRQRTTTQVHTTTTTTTTTTPSTTTSTTTTTTATPPLYVNTNTRRPKPTNKRLIVKHTQRPRGKASRPVGVYETPAPFSKANKCNNDICLLPDCKCGNSAIPGNLPVDDIPQIVLLTFDDAVNDLNWDIYEELFSSGRKNPNGCPLVATYYVSHEWTDYGQVQTLYSRGHEMASHGITHSFGEKFSKNQWLKEINGQREILYLYGGVKFEDVRGMRAPFLQIGGNKMFEMLYDTNFTYDSSMPVFDNKPPFWPYTLDYAINHECMISPCPTKSFPGVWEVGMVMWEDLRGGRCSMGDACSNPSDEDGVFEMLMKNFNRHYKSNRAPLGLFYHSAWFNTQHHRRGFARFLDEVLKKKDVFFTTNWQMLQWVRDPTPVSHIDKFQPWNCRAIIEQRPRACIHANVCNVASKSGSRFMKTCQPCPNFFPWVGKTGFESN